MRIAHFIHRYPPALGGAESYFSRLSEYLQMNDHDVSVFTSNAHDLSAFWSPQGRCLEAGDDNHRGVCVRRFPLWRIYGRRWLLKPLSMLTPSYSWKCLLQTCNPISRQMWQAANSEQRAFDIVHASAFPYAFPIICAWKMAKRQGIPLCLTPFVHTGDPDDAKDRTRRQYLSPHLCWLLRQADAIFVQTPTERNAVIAVGVAPEKIILQGLGVDDADCTGGNRKLTRTRWQIPEDAPVVGHLANQSAEKGSIDLLRAAEILWRSGADFRVILAGPEMPNFLRFLKTYAFTDRIIRLGSLSEEDKRNFFAAIDLFALPSRCDSFGLVLLEAWANGVPNVAYRAGGIADVIRHGQDGLLVQCGDILALAESIAKLCQDKALRHQLGQNGYQRLPKDFSWPEKLAIVEEKYRELVRR